MADNPTYLLWTPRLATGPGGGLNLRLNVTPHASHEMPRGPVSFFTDLVHETGVSGDAVGGQVRAYRTSYHGEIDSDASWLDQWPLNWLVTIQLEGSVNPGAIRFEEGYESYAWARDPARYEREPSEAEVDCIILADFGKREGGEKAIELIEGLRKTEPQAQALDSLDFEWVEVEERFWQIQIALGRFPASFYQEGAPFARRIEQACRAAGGWTTFEDRIAAIN